MSDNWAHSAQSWVQIQPPLRPVAQELDAITVQLQQLAASRVPLQVLVMGTTPEYWQLPWPASAQVLAVDSSPAMLAQVWPGPPASRLEADWRDIPLASGSQDLILLDLGLALMDWPQEQTRAVQEFARLLAPGGLLIMRLLVLPDLSQTPAQVYRQIRAGQIPNLGSLRIAMWMAMQQHLGRAVTNVDVWSALQAEFGSWAQLAQALHWDPDFLSEFANTRLKQAWRQFHFARLEDYLALCCRDSGSFTLETTLVPDYFLAERCPSLVLRKR